MYHSNTGVHVQVATVLNQFKKFLGPELKSVTGESAGIDEIIERVHGLAVRLNKARNVSIFLSTWLGRRLPRRRIPWRSIAPSLALCVSVSCHGHILRFLLQFLCIYIALAEELTTCSSDYRCQEP